MTTLRRLGITMALALLAVLTSAHVGSPDVYYSAKSGAYVIDVVIRAPQVVPGLANILVKVSGAQATRVVIRPVFWRAGVKGAPLGDDASEVRGQPGAFEGQLWLMETGAYSVDVHVEGAAGNASIRVPVVSVATGQLALSTALKVILFILGSLLVAGTVTAIYAAVGESQVAPGEGMPPERRRRARIAAGVAIPVVALLLTGASNWWKSEAAAYRSTLYKPLPVHSTLSVQGRETRLTMKVGENAWYTGGMTALMPDHGKLAHMFLVAVDSPFTLAHLHPDMPDRETFTTALPPLPAGKYRIFADVVHESGFQRTLADSVNLTNVDSQFVSPALTVDEAWSEDRPMHVGHAMEIRGHTEGLYVAWVGPERVVAQKSGVLSFAFTDIHGQPVMIEPYLGMDGHAVVVRSDGKVFIHLHPNGTSSMASELAMTIRDRGDTTLQGRLHMTAMDAMMPTEAHLLRHLDFPYAFPSAGRYRVYVQVKMKGKVHTTSFDVVVNES